ncbi:MAG: M50 family metallopeptidase [Planctomycetota bacterium]
MQERSKPESTGVGEANSLSGSGLHSPEPGGPEGRVSTGVERAGPFWITLTIGRGCWRLHMLTVLVAAALYWNGLWWRYLLILAVLALHESAHAWAALALGAKRVEVRIWPLFGRALVERFPDRRLALVAAAGPVFNLLAAAGLALLGAEFNLRIARCSWPDLLFTANLVMGLGNLLPIPPADGGRVLAALRRGAKQESDGMLSESCDS